MNKNKKHLAVLSTAAITTLLTSALSGTVQAATDKIATKTKDTGKSLEYNLKALTNDAIQNALGKASPLFDDYMKTDVVAFHDDVTGLYVNATDVNKAATKAAVDGTQFDVNGFTEKAKADQALQLTGVTERVLDGTTVKDATPATVALASVTAVNGTVTVNFDKAPTAVKAADLVVTKSIAVGTQTPKDTTVTIADADVTVSGTVATVKVPTIDKADSAQTVTYKVTYGGATKEAAAFTVDAKDITTTGSVISVSAITDINVDNGTTKDVAITKLPTTVGVTMSDKTTANKAVTNWTCANYDAATAGTYAFTGDVADTTIKAAVNVVVAAKTAATVTGVTNPADVTVDNGTTQGAIGLPTTVAVTLSDKTTGTKAVTWDAVSIPAYDGTKEGTYVFAGTVEGTTTTKATINIKVKAAAVKTLAVDSVSAVNGTVTAVLGKAPGSVPTVNDFKVKVSVNGATATDVTPTDVEWNLTTLTAKLTVPTIAQGDVDKSVAYSAGYRDTDAKTATAFTVAKADKLQVAGVKVISGNVSKDAVKATDVNVNSAVELTFSDVYLASTIDLNSVKIINKTTQAQIPGNFVYDTVNKKATFYPNVLMQDSCSYTVQVTDVVKSADGTKQLAAYSTEFATGAITVASNLIVTTPITTNGGSTTTAGADGVLNAAQPITVQFSKDIDASTLNTGTFKLFNITQNKYVANSTATIGYAAATRTATFTAGADQQLGDRFRVEVVGVKDLSGKDVAPFLYEFVTGAAVAPTLQALSPASPNVFPKIQAATINGTYFQGFKLVYTFTSAMNKDTLNTQTVQIREQGTTVGVGATVSYDTVSNTLTIVPTTDLKTSKAYEVYFDTNTIKTASGRDMTNPNTAFTTGDYDAPTVASTTPANYATGVVESDKIKVTFNEPLTTASVVGANDENFSATESVVLLNSSGTGVNISAPGVITFEDSNKTVVINTSALALTRGTTYTLKFNGGSNSSNLVVKDASAANPGGSGNSLAAEYDLSFTTRNADTAPPVVEKVLKGSTYASATDFAAASKDARFNTGDNLYVVFNELLDNATAAIQGDSSSDANDDGNLIIERRAAGTTAWTQVDINTGDGPALKSAATVTDDLQSRKTYIAIPNVALNAANANDSYEYRVRILPTAGGGVVQDVPGNDLASTYTFGFIRKGGTFNTGYTATAAGTAIARDTVVAPGIAAGAGSANPAFTATGGINIANGSIAAIEQNDGSFFFGTVDDNAGGAIDSLTENLPTSGGGAAALATIVNMTTNSTSFAQLETGISRTAPIAIRIDGTATAGVDINTITSDTVKLTKSGTAVPADVTYRVIGNSAYVSINPQGTLDAATKYDLTVSGVKDTLGNTLTTTATSFTTATAAANTLSISTVTPADNATSIAVNAPITVAFNESVVDASASGRLTTVGGASINAGATTADGANVLATVGIPTAAGTTTIGLYNLTDTTWETGRLSVSADGKTVTILPDSLLIANKVYQVRVGGGLTSNNNTAVADTAIGSESKYSFTTEANASVLPAVSSALYIDADGSGTVNVNDLLVVTFNTAMTTANIGTVSADHDAEFGFTLSGALDGAGNNSTAAWSTDEKTVTITLGTNPVIVPNATKIGGIPANLTKNGVALSTTQVTITK